MFTKDAIFAGGCFWCVEHDFKTAPGTTDVISGYIGGTAETANYENVSNHKTFHREAVRVKYDPSKTSYKKLCQFFLDHIDPTDGGGQFADRGLQYQPVIYYKTWEEEEIARGLLVEIDESKIFDRPAAVRILKETEFFPAEEYHQDYAKKNPQHYGAYRIGSGREEFVNNVCQLRTAKIPWKG